MVYLVQNYVPPVSHFIWDTLLYLIFLFEQKISFRPLETGLQQILFPKVPGGKGLKEIFYNMIFLYNV